MTDTVEQNVEEVADYLFAIERPDTPCAYWQEQGWQAPGDGAGMGLTASNWRARGKSCRRRTNGG